MLKNKLKNYHLTIGSWITLGDASIAEILVKSGFDWLVVDLEHSSISIRQASELIRVIDLGGVTPLVRLTSNNVDQIKRVMDAGAHGIVVPMVNTQQDAIKAVSATRYAPTGIRGVGLARAQGYGANFQEYFEWQQENPVVIVQIEHIDALKNLKMILSTDGVDGFIIGPYDLSCSMGIPGEFTHPEFLKVIDNIFSIGKQMNVPAGIHIVEADQAYLKDSIEKGYKFIAYSVDIRMLDSCARSGLSSIQRNK